MFENLINMRIQRRLPPNLKTTHNIEDVAQEVQLKLLGVKVDELNPAFVSTICDNVISDYVRKQNVRPDLTHNDNNEHEVAKLPQTCDGTCDLSEQVDQMLSGCSDEAQYVFKMTRKGYTSRQIGEQIGKSHTYVQRLIAKQITRMKGIVNAGI